MRFRPVGGFGLGKGLAYGLPIFAFLGVPLHNAQAQQARPWQISPSLSISETFTDNEGLDPNGEKDPALITTVAPAVSVTVSLPKLTANVSGNLDLRYQTLNDEGFDVSGGLGGFTNVEWFESLLFTDFRASISQELLNTEDGQSGSANNTQNLDTVQNYQISPYLTNRIGDYADSELRFQGSYTDSTSDELSQSYGGAASWNLNSGPEFQTLLWSTVAKYDYLHRPNDSDVQSSSAELDLRLVLDPIFSLLGNAGFQQFDDNEDSDFEEPIWEAGFLLSPSPRAELSYLYGKRNDAKSHTVSARYDITARTTIQAAYFESLSTDQNRLGQNLSSIGSSSTGSQINTNTNQAFSSNSSTTSVDNETTRTKTATLDVSSVFGRNTLTVNGGFEDRNVRNSADDEQAYTAGFEISRQFTQSVTAALTGSYEMRIFDLSADTDTYLGAVSLSYALTQSLSTFADYSYQRRFSSDSSEQFTENTVTIGIDIAF